MQSLVENKNVELIEQAIQEAEQLRNEKGYISGVTDGNYHPVYQTKWLIFGLQNLGLDSSKYTVPEVSDTYEALLWFDKEIGIEYNQLGIDTSWPYLYYAYLHFHNIQIDLVNIGYPISYELEPSKADFSKLEIIGNYYKEKKLVVPHSWSAAEMFLYVIER